MPAPPVAIGFKIAIAVEWTQSLARLVDQPSLDLGGNAVPVPVDRGRQGVLGVPACTKLPLAQIARDGFDVFPVPQPWEQRSSRILRQTGRSLNGEPEAARIRIPSSDHVANHAVGRPIPPARTRLLFQVAHGFHPRAPPSFAQ